MHVEEQIIMQFNLNSYNVTGVLGLVVLSIAYNWFINV